MNGALPATATDATIAPRAQSLLRFFTCGSVDDGKSTLIGRMLYDTNSVFEDQLEALERDSKKFGTQGANLDFALLLDGLSAEREQGITIDVAYRYFGSNKRAFIVADTPGHEQYTRNMATGASTAELAIILIDARKGILPQTRRHSFIVSMLGVRDIVLAVNKMDLVGFDEDVFNAIVESYRELTAGLGFAHVVAIPLSARDGDNIATHSQRTPWYRGPSLLAHLETVEPVPASAETAFAMPVQWVNRPDLDFRGYAGTIASGAIKRGDEIMALPGARRSKVARIIGPDGERDQAIAGEAVTLTLTDEIDVSRGDVLASTPHHLKPRRTMDARLLWMIDAPLAPGRDYIIQLATGTANARIAALHHQIDVESFQPRHAQVLTMNQIGFVSLACDKALVMADYRQDRDLGAFILIDRLTNQTAALGVIEPAVAVAAETSIALAVAPSLWARIGPHLDAGDAVLSVALAMGVYILSTSAPAAAAVLVTDLVLRPTLGFARTQARAKAAPGTDENIDSGAGI